MNAKILNRDFQHPSDGWYQIEPKGDHLNKAAKVIQVIDDEAVLQIVNRFNADADQPGFAGMLIDHEHFKHDAEKETRAYGWLMRLANRDDGIYGQIKWTGTGKPAVDSGDYRYFSTEYDPADLKVLNATGALRRIRPMRLDGLTLTNSPNNRGGRPITNRTEAGATNLADANAAAANQTTNERTNTMKSIATKLGLAAEASEDAILASVTNLMNRAAEAEGKITPLNTEIGTLKNRNTELETEQCSILLDACGVKEEKLRNRLSDGLKLLKNREERLTYLADFGYKPSVGGEKKETHGRVLNRQNTTDESAEAGDDQAKSRKIVNRANELKSTTPGRTFESCWQQANRELAS